MQNRRSYLFNSWKGNAVPMLHGNRVIGRLQFDSRDKANLPGMNAGL